MGIIRPGFRTRPRPPLGSSATIQVSQDVKEVLAVYELLNQEILDKQALLNEKLDEQARYDSMG